MDPYLGLFLIPQELWSCLAFPRLSCCSRERSRTLGTVPGLVWREGHPSPTWGTEPEGQSIPVALQEACNAAGVSGKRREWMFVSGAALWHLGLLRGTLLKSGWVGGPSWRRSGKVWKKEQKVWCRVARHLLFTHFLF